MDKEISTVAMGESGHGSIRSYGIGFALSLLFTLIAYFLVTEKIVEGGLLTTLIVSLALLQAITQLIFFLHLGDEPKPYWNLLVFFFMLMVIIIIVGGSLWIMANLDQRLMPMNHS